MVGLSIAFLGNGLHSATVMANQGYLYLNTSGTASKFAPTGTIKGTYESTPFIISWNCGGALSPE